MKIEERLQWLQPQLFQQFAHALKQGQMAHAYLFEGPPGTGKKELALWLAAAAFCQQPLEGNPCLECANCQRVLTHQHPDVVEVAPDGLSIKVDQVRTLKAEFSKRGVEGTQKIFIIEDAEKMTTGAANSLLKFLEEPEGKVTAFLLTSAKQRLLPTILSRCQLVHFRPLPKQVLLTELEQSGIPTSQASLLVHLTNNAGTAAEMNQDEWFTEAKGLIWKWFTYIAKQEKQSFVFVHTDLMPHFRDRDQYYLAMELLLLAYRDALKLQYNLPEMLAFPTHKQELEQVAEHLRGKGIVEAIETILSGRKKLESNVNAQGVFEQLALVLAA